MPKTLEEIWRENGTIKAEESTETTETETQVETTETQVEETENQEVETQVETTETETQTETEVEQPKSFIEKLKEVTEAKVEVTEEKPNPEAAAELLAEIEAYKTKLANYESDPLHKAVNMGASREELLAIAAELKGKDYSKSVFSDLIAVEIARETGLEGEKLIEQVELAIDEYNSLPEYKQIIEEKKLRNKFQSEVKAGESPTLQAIEAAYADKTKGFKTPEDIAVERQNIAKQETEAIKSVGKGLVGAVLHGVEFTEAMLNEIVTKDYHIDKVNDFVDEKGNLDIGNFIQTKFITKNLAAMIEWAKEEGKREANKGTAVTKTAKKGASTVVQEDARMLEMKARGVPEYLLKTPKAVEYKD